VAVGGIGSLLLSALHVHPLFSVGFALIIMGILSYLRWRIASEFNDFQSLEAFAEDIYLLGYLLTLSALLGLAPRLMSEDTNLFNIAGLKLVTTVVGLALMMIFRQTARRWAEEKEGETQAKFEQQQQLFSAAVARLNEGADQLTSKLDEVVRRFDPDLLIPMADWSNRAANTFSLVTSHLEALPASVQNGIQHLEALTSNLEQVKTAAAELAGVLTAGTAQAANVLTAELGQATHAAAGFSHSVAAFTPVGDSTRDAIEKLGNQVSKGESQFSQVGANLHTTALELGKVERVLKKFMELHNVDTTLPLNRLVEVLESSVKTSSISNERFESVKAGLNALTIAGQEVSKRIETHVGLPLSDNHQVLTQVQGQIARAAEQMERMSKLLEDNKQVTQPQSDDSKQLHSRLTDLHKEMGQTNQHFQTLLQRLDGEHTVEQRSGFMGLFKGKR
jgi:hypothetical protein